MSRKIKKRSIHYCTQWVHRLLGIEHAVYIENNTPIEEILPKLEEVLKKERPGLEPNYQKSITSFWKLYRNLIPVFKGWSVYYSKNPKQEPYDFIKEKIEYKEQPRNYFVEKQLTNRMVWSHKSYPTIQPIEIGPISSCKKIAELLNNHGKKSSIKPLLDDWYSYIESLNHNYEALKQKKITYATLPEQESWQQISEDFKHLYAKSKTLNHSKDNWRLSEHNIHELVKFKCKTIKGWSVKFLND